VPTAEYRESYNDGHAAYRMSRYEEATLLFLRARSVAASHRALREECDALVWAAESSNLTANSSRTLALRFEAAASETGDAPTVQRWRVAKGVFDHYLYVQFDRARTMAQLRRLEGLAPQLSELVGSDVPLLHAKLCVETGDWANALAYAERAATLWSPGGFGWIESASARFAFRCSLRCGRLEDAKRWLEVLARTDQDRPDARLATHVYRTWLARATARNVDLETLSVPIEEEASRIQRDSTFADAAIVRVALLIPRHGDPEASFHPARARLRSHQPRSRWLRVDYRLACLRWAAGIDPEDDEFYWINPHRVPESAFARDLTDFRARARRAQIAIERSLRWAKRRDDGLECTWRQEDFAERQRRLDAIVLAVERGANLAPGTLNPRHPK
jgi:hypothetical protein